MATKRRTTSSIKKTNDNTNLGAFIDSSVISNTPMKCSKCGTYYQDQKSNFPITYSKVYQSNNNYVCLCNSCLDMYFNECLQNFDGDEYATFRYLCAILDIYYKDELVDNTMNNAKPQERLSFYLKKTIPNKTYKDTIKEDYVEKEKIRSVDEMLQKEQEGIITQKDVKFWGFGFSESEYVYLNEKYHAWITRHECKTMAQEEIFKKLSLMDLEMLRCMQAGEKYSDLLKQYNDYLSSANIKPTQQNDNVLTDGNSFGLFIKKIEYERPISEPLKEWQDVDNIKKYIRVWFLGHLSKMFGLQNKYAQEYDEEVGQYTVTPPSYDDNGSDGDTPNFEDVFK